jgi:hypothetical protein
MEPPKKKQKKAPKPKPSVPLRDDFWFYGNTRRTGTYFDWLPLEIVKEVRTWLAAAEWTDVVREHEVIKNVFETFVPIYVESPKCAYSSNSKYHWSRCIHYINTMDYPTLSRQKTAARNEHKRHLTKEIIDEGVKRDRDFFISTGGNAAAFDESTGFDYAPRNILCKLNRYSK